MIDFQEEILYNCTVIKQVEALKKWQKKLIYIGFFLFLPDMIDFYGEMLYNNFLIK